MKNYSIEFFRFFFMLFICLTHFPGRTAIHLNHAYLAVDFFFIVSGLFIYKSSCKEKPLSTFDFSFKKIKRFYPKLVIGCILITLLQPTWLHHFGSLKDIVLEWRNVVNELCFVMNIGIFGAGKNPPIWYLSTLIVVGAILYSFLVFNRMLSLRIIFPLILMSLTYVFSQTDGTVMVWGVDGFLYRPFLRGFAGMGIGILCGHFLQYYKDRISTRFVNITSVISLSGILFIMFFETALDVYIFLFAPFVVLSCFYGESLIYRCTSHEIWDIFGGITYDMLILHCPIINVIVLANRYIQLPYTPFFLICYLLIVVVSCFLFNRIYAACFNRRMLRENITQ